jgi:hypothetical protein
VNAERVREMVAFAMLKDAVLKSGMGGESADTAYVALSVLESRQIVKELGFDIQSQALRMDANRSFDVYVAIDPKTQAKRTIWVDGTSLLRN